VTVTKFQLEETFGTSDGAQQFIKEIIGGQVGTPHPQSKTTLMYKVLKEVVAKNSQLKITSKTTSVDAEITDPASRKLIAEGLDERSLEHVKHMHGSKHE